jgi:pyruvate dehydrogenase E1 component
MRWLVFTAEGELSADHVEPTAAGFTVQLNVPIVPTTDYIDTTAPENEPEFPGDEAIERTDRAWMRWSACRCRFLTARNVRAFGVGGHISTFASFGHFGNRKLGSITFSEAKTALPGGDQYFIQGHASPGPYSRAFLEGRYRQRSSTVFVRRSPTLVALSGLSSPPDYARFLAFPTVSMGIGPINAIYQAQFNRYLAGRGLKEAAADQHVWAFLGDGELDEVESRGALQLAANDGLDNLTFVVNCNLHAWMVPFVATEKSFRNSKSFFRGAGWNVIKVVWGREWDALLQNDLDGALVDLMNKTPNGDYQTFQDRRRRIRQRKFLRTRPAHPKTR